MSKMRNVGCEQALYHGKPVIAMPFFGDQPSNADRVVAKVGHQTQTMLFSFLPNDGDCFIVNLHIKRQLVRIDISTSSLTWHDCSF